MLHKGMLDWKSIKKHNMKAERPVFLFYFILKREELKVSKM